MSIVDMAAALAGAIVALPQREKIAALNAARTALHAVSPFRHEPVDLVLWVPCDTVRANDYNPNSVAPPEMQLLRHSVIANGYTQPIVAHAVEDGSEVVDGFHRHRVGKESTDVKARVLGHLPVVHIRADRNDRGARIAATVQHNRARGEHGVDKMSALVRMLCEAGWTDKQIEKELGMEIDEVLRMKQITGLAALFADREFSQAWEPTDGQ